VTGLRLIDEVDHERTRQRPVPDGESGPCAPATPSAAASLRRHGGKVTAVRVPVAWPTAIRATMRTAALRSHDRAAEPAAL